jgi:site-specific DNA-methyltransferase (adenine-specific)
MNEIANEDCLTYMAKMQDESVDLILSDPPYQIDYQSNRRVVRPRFDKIENDVNSIKLIEYYVKQSHRILKPNTAIYLFCSWHNVDIFKQIIEDCFTLKNIIVWVKNNHGSGDLKGSYAPQHEFILFAHKGRALNRGQRLPDVLHFNKVASARLTHPTEKPILLLQALIQNNTDKDDVVFDGFAGTGSTLIAAKESERRYLGCEIATQYYDIAKERLF